MSLGSVKQIVEGFQQSVVGELLTENVRFFILELLGGSNVLDSIAVLDSITITVAGDGGSLRLLIAQA